MHRLFSLICAAVAVLSSHSLRADATNPPLSSLVPEDKKLDASWVKSLTERGEPHVCRGAELKYIGMPVGGLFAGQLYLGGDGQLWHWDIFNGFYFTGWAGNYAPMPVTKPLEQSFSLIVNGKELPLDTNSFSDITFRGEYPMAFINYRDPKQPVEVDLTAFSPFIPLNLNDSSLPLTVLEYTLKNTSDRPVTVTLKGILENFILDRGRGALNGTRLNTVTTNSEMTLLEETAVAEIKKISTSDHMLEDWSKPDFSAWKVDGSSFGTSPFHVKTLTEDQKKQGLNKLGDSIDGFVSSLPYALRGSEKKPSGRMTSTSFTIDRKHLYFWIRPEDRFQNNSGLELVVDGKAVASFYPNPSHSNARQLQLRAINVSPYRGKQAVIQLVDNEHNAKTGITVGKIFLSDREYLYNPTTAKHETRELTEDNGSMALALLDGVADLQSGNQQIPATDKLIGLLGRTLTLQPGESRKLTFLVAWFFPNLNHIPSVKEQGRWYASKFHSAGDVVRYFVQNRNRLGDDTRKWHDTWYNSTLPFWFLDRTLMTIDNLATSSNYRFKNGRWWAWEGVGACEGTCGHVYGYAQAVARLFPEIERDQRERVDFATSLTSDGWIDCRGESKGGAAIDAQAFYILRALREHQMSADKAFLARIWPGVKKAMEYMIKQDPGEKGVIEGAQHNTLDADWRGEVAWYNGLYLAALNATAEMADVMKEPETATRYRKIATAGGEYMTKNLFNGEYFQNKVDPAHLNTINSGTGSEIDQVLGQSWAFQVGLPRVLPKKETISSLQSLWKYNFAPNVGPFRATYKKGRTYAEAGESGLIMCTFPRPDWDLGKASGQGNEMYASYFNECMTGFEHQVAGHMIWEGEPDGDLVTKGLAIEHAVHDRYAPAKRNPYNEVECGDHYGRAMASYGVFIAACGFQYDGPRGMIGFAPRIHPEHFKAAFTSAEGWGSYSQSIKDGTMTAELALNYGKISLQKICLDPGVKQSYSVKVTLDGKEIPATLTVTEGHAVITLEERTVFSKGEILKIILS